MTGTLQLKGNELLVYSVIHSFSQGEQGCFYGSLNTLAEIVGCTFQTALTTLKSLTEKGLINKRDIYADGVKRCAYTATQKIGEGTQKILGGYSKNLSGGTQNFLPNNKEYIENNITPINGSKNARAKKTIEERASEFKASLAEYVSAYGQPMLDAFFNYWTEPNQSRTKMRWEMEKTWETGRRLATWNAREQSRPKSAAQLAEERRKEEERRYVAALDEGTREYLKLTGQVR